MSRIQRSVEVVIRNISRVTLLLERYDLISGLGRGGPTAQLLPGGSCTIRVIDDGTNWPHFWCQYRGRESTLLTVEAKFVGKYLAATVSNNTNYFCIKSQQFTSSMYAQRLAGDVQFREMG